MQNNIKIKLAYIARWLVHRKSQQQLLHPIVFPPLEQHIQNNFDDVSPLRIKVHLPPPPQKKKH